MIGERVVRVDGWEKVTGRAVYGDDVELPGLLHAACRYTDYPSARLTRLDLDAARRAPGVVAVVTGSDVPGQRRIGPIRQDHLPIVEDRVFYAGDVLCVVAARTRAQAQAAADLVHAEYEQLPGVFDVREAAQPDAALVHPEYGTNLVVHHPLRRGNVEEGFAQSDEVLEREYRTGFHEHAYLEPESVTAVPDPITGGVRVLGSIQNPYTTRAAVARYLGLKLARVEVLPSTIGGSFGGKDDIVNAMACRVALLARMTGRPVKLTNTREQSLVESYKRHPYLLKYRVGFRRDGRLVAMKIEILADSGAYLSMSPFVTWRSVVQATGPYEVPNVETDVRAVYTNNSYTGAFRGFGSPQIVFAQESLMDEIAEKCGLTPLEVRRLNGYRQGSSTASGQLLSEHTVSLHQVIGEAIARSEYEGRLARFREENAKGGRFRYGIGLAASYRGCSLGGEGTDAVAATVALQPDGSIYVFCGLHENGQGLRTTFCQIAASILGARWEDVVYPQPQTSQVQDSGATVASRSTLMGGGAVAEAAKQVKETLFSHVRERFGVAAAQELEWSGGVIRRKGPPTAVTPGIDPVEEMALAQAALSAAAAGESLSGHGWFRAPKVSWDEHTGQGDAYFTYVYGCQIAEVRGDTHTGKVDVLKVTAAHDLGRVINRLGAEGQVYGGVTQGMGYALLEDFNIQRGQVKSDNFDQYLIPTAREIGGIVPVFVENPDRYGPFGAKSLGEPTLELTAAAINNAVAFATGTRSTEIPLTLEKVFLGRRLDKPERQSEVAHASRNRSAARLGEVTVVTPKSLEEALERLEREKLTVLAGGSDLLVTHRKSPDPVRFLNVLGLPELRGVTEDDEGFRVGAATTFSELIESPLARHYPVLTRAAALIGSKQIRNRATIGGNVVNAAPCADSVPPLVLYGARAEIASKAGTWSLAIEDLITGNYRTALLPGEMVVAFRIPPLAPRRWVDSYFKLGRRNAVNITRMSLSILAALDGERVEEIRIVPGSVFARNERLGEIERRLVGRKLDAETLASLEQPLAALLEERIGGRWSSAYKVPVFAHMLKDGLEEVRVRAGEQER